MKTWSIEIRPIISQEVGADTWEEAKEKLRETFEEQPWELDDIDDSEIHDVTPPDEGEQKLLNRLEGQIELIERWGNPTSLDAKNVRFKEDEFEGVLEEGELPRFVYADIHTYDGCGGETVNLSVEYSVEELLKNEKQQGK